MRVAMVAMKNTTMSTPTAAPIVRVMWGLP
jgi:hypothetical protein